MTSVSSVNSSSADTTSTTGSSNSSSTNTSSGSSSNSNISFSGLVSGLDTTSIINKMADVYGAPMKVLQANETELAQKQAAWDDIKTKMEALQSSIQDLQKPSAIANRTGSVTPPNGKTAPLSVTASSTAAIGSFTINVHSLASSAVLMGGGSVSKPIDTTTTPLDTTPLVSLGLGISVTTGTLTVNGQQITIDSSTTLTGSGDNTLQKKLADVGVTLTANVNSSGKLTGITLESTSNPSSNPIQLGSSSDTSTFLSAFRLTTSTGWGAGTITSNGSLTSISTSTPIGSISFDTSLTGSNGTFQINGVSIDYTSTDTLGSIISKINASSAGVTAAYDSLSDMISLAGKATGTGPISVRDKTGGNLAAALKLTTASGATSTGGTPAKFTISGINGGREIASASNTVTNLVSGVTLKLTGVSGSDGDSTVTISPDTSSVKTGLENFVKAYNDVQDVITKYTQIVVDSTGNPQSVGIMAGDSGLTNLATSLDRLVNGTSVSIEGKKYSLATLGISTGSSSLFSLGSSTLSYDLAFDSTNLSDVLDAVPTLAQAFGGNGTISSQKGTLFKQLNDVVDAWTSPLGIIGSSHDSLTSQYANDEVQIRNWQERITNYRQQLSDQFTAMESALSSLQTQSQSLTSFFNSLNSSSSK
jgi:flagellar hook-associated protein 2